MKKIRSITLGIFFCFCFLPMSEAGYIPSGASGDSSKEMSALHPSEKSEFKMPSLSPEYQSVYEIGGKLYRMDENSILVPLSPEEESLYKQGVTNKVEVEALSKEKKESADIEVKQIDESAYKEEGSEGASQEEAVNEELASDERLKDIEEALDNLDQEKKGVQQEEAVEGDLSLKGMKAPSEEKEEKLTVGSDQKERKLLRTIKKLKIEGLPDEVEEEEQIRVVPQIKMQKQEKSPDVGMSGEKSGDSVQFEDKIPKKQGR